MANTFDRVKHWAERATGYRETMESDYNRNRLTMIDALLRPDDLRGRVIDFGCGDGIYTERSARAGGKVHAIDIEPSMVESTRDRARAANADVTLSTGGVEVLASVASGTIDTVLALNVLHYVDASEATRFYEETQRILRPGGVFVVTHSNTLFDLFTLNKYTVAFFKANFAMYADMDRVADLLRHPDQPVRHLVPYRENPLNFKHTLAKFDLLEEQQEFSILHEQPPLIMPGFDPDALMDRRCLDTLGWPEDQRWKLMFMCSIFGSRARKRETHEVDRSAPLATA